MKEAYEVTLKFTAIVLVGEDEDAEEVARSERGEIVNDHYNPEIEIGMSFRSRAELKAHGELVGSEWDDMCIPYGGDGNTRLGTILDDIEASDIAKAGAMQGRCLLTTDMFEEPMPERPAEPPQPPNFKLMVARAHAKAGENWQWATMRFIGDGQGAGTLIEGGVPNISPDGKRRWAGVATVEVFVTEEQELAAGLAWEKETGNCMKCAGSGQMNTGWHHEHGNRYAPCNRCNATGKAPAQ